MEFGLEAMDTESLREQLQSIEQEYSVSYGSRVLLDLSNPHEQLKQTIEQLNQRERTCACIAGIALFLMDKQEELMDKQVIVESEIQNQQMELNELRENMKMFQIKLDKKSEKKKQAQFENRSLKSTIEEIKKQLQEQMNSLIKAKDKNKMLKLENMSFKTRSSETNEHQKAIENQIEQCKFQIKRQDKYAQQLEKERKELQINLNQEKSMREQFSEEIEHLQGEAQVTRYQVDQMKEQLTHYKDLYQGAKSELQEQKDLVHELLKEKEMYDTQYEISPNRKSSVVECKNSGEDLDTQLFHLEDNIQKANQDVNELAILEEPKQVPNFQKKISWEETEKQFKGNSQVKQRALISITQEEKQEAKAMRFVTNFDLSHSKHEYIYYAPQKQQFQRDPIEQHFQLLTQSVKINSPYMDQICTVSHTNLYNKCIKQTVPIHKWHQ